MRGERGSTKKLAGSTRQTNAGTAPAKKTGEKGSIHYAGKREKGDRLLQNSAGPIISSVIGEEALEAYSLERKERTSNASLGQSGKKSARGAKE